MCSSDSYVVTTMKYILLSLILFSAISLSAQVKKPAVKGKKFVVGATDINKLKNSYYNFYDKEGRLLAEGSIELIDMTIYPNEDQTMFPMVYRCHFPNGLWFYYVPVNNQQQFVLTGEWIYYHHSSYFGTTISKKIKYNHGFLYENKVKKGADFISSYFNNEATISENEKSRFEDSVQVALDIGTKRNRLSKEGNKIGYWEEYDPNGFLSYAGNYIETASFKNHNEIEHHTDTTKIYSPAHSLKAVSVRDGVWKAYKPSFHYTDSAVYYADLFYEKGKLAKKVQTGFLYNIADKMTFKYFEDKWDDVVETYINDDDSVVYQRTIDDVMSDYYPDESLSFKSNRFHIHAEFGDLVTIPLDYLLKEETTILKAESSSANIQCVSADGKPVDSLLLNKSNGNRLQVLYNAQRDSYNYYNHLKIYTAEATYQLLITTNSDDISRKNFKEVDTLVFNKSTSYMNIHLQRLENHMYFKLCTEPYEGGNEYDNFRKLEPILSGYHHDTGSSGAFDISSLEKGTYYLVYNWEHDNVFGIKSVVVVVK